MVSRRREEDIPVISEGTTEIDDSNAIWIEDNDASEPEEERLIKEEDTDQTNKTTP